MGSRSFAKHPTKRTTVKDSAINKFAECALILEIISEDQQIMDILDEDPFVGFAAL